VDSAQPKAAALFFVRSSADNSDGWIFKDQKGNSINLGGDVKVIRLNGDANVADKYCEYHAEFANGLSYYEACQK